MKKAALWLLPVITLVGGFYLGSMYKNPTTEKAVITPVEENKSVVVKSEPLFTFETPAGYESKVEDNGATLWKEGRPKPTGDSDAMPDLSVVAIEKYINDARFAGMNPVQVRTLTVSGYGARYYKITDDYGDSYAVVVDVKDDARDAWIYIQTPDQNLLDKVLVTFKINK